MTIYLDEIFVINLLMDAFMLWATGKLLQRPVPVLRLLISAILGAIYGVIIFLPACIWMADGLAKTICALLMAWFAFGWGNWRMYLKTVIYLYLVSFVLCGATIALMYFFGQQIVQTWSGIALIEVEFRFIWLVGGVILILFIVQLLHKAIQKSMEHSVQIATVTIRLRNKTEQLRLLVDSGNCLTDPISGVPVIVVQMKCVQSLFTDAELQYMEVGAADAVLRLPDLSDRLRLLPFQTVGYRGLMLGVRLDELQIQESSMQGMSTVRKNVVMALSPQQFASDGSYQGVIPPLLL